MKFQLFILVLVTIIEIVLSAKGDFGCGQNGQCWTWCDGGAGWCYTGFGCKFKGECDANAECQLPRVCNHQW